MQANERLKSSLKKTTRTFFNVLPIIVGMLLMTSLVVTIFPEQISSGLFGKGDVLDTLLGASFGSIAAGHPLVSYILGGELLGSGVSLLAVTALVVTWVTVGIVQLPAEAMMLGVRFALYRNVISFITAISITFMTVSTLQLLKLI